MSSANRRFACHSTPATGSGEIANEQSVVVLPPSEWRLLHESDVAIPINGRPSNVRPPSTNASFAPRPTYGTIV